MKNKIAFKILVYSGAIDYLKRKTLNGICFGLQDALERMGYPIGVAYGMTEDYEKSIGEHFPEIWKYKPNRDRGWWWPKHDRQIRIKILETEIEKLFDKLLNPD